MDTFDRALAFGFATSVTFALWRIAGAIVEHTNVLNAILKELSK